MVLMLSSPLVHASRTSSPLHTRCSRTPNVKFVNLNVGSFDAHKMGSFPVIGDAKLSLAALRERLAAIDFGTSADYRSEIADARKATLEVRKHDLQAFPPGENMSQAQVIDVLNRTATNQDALILAPVVWLRASTRPGIRPTALKSTSSTPTRAWAMRFRPASATGSHVGDAPGEVYVLIGDGTYFMQPTELVTAVQERKKIITIVIDNRGHQCIWPLQVSKGGPPGASSGHSIGNAALSPVALTGAVLDFDIAANAASMGCAAWSTSTVEEFQNALKEAKEGGDGPPAVIVARVEPWRYLSGSGAFWDVGVPMTSQRPGSQEGTAKHLEGRARQRFYAATTAPDQR